MIYPPAVTVFRSDDGGWIEPYKIDVVTSPAVNADVVRRGAGANVEGEIARVMRERMARVLYLFEQSGVRDLVLGSFGTGVFRNNVRVVASIWMDLPVVDGARFKGSFDHVVFALLGRETYDEFQKTFKEGRKDT